MNSDRNQNALNQEIDDCLGEFFFGCNIALVNIESDFFRKFINKLNPNYKIPSRKTLSTSILDRLYQKAQTSVAQVAPKDAVLMLDGWKNKSKNSKNVVGLLRLSNGDTVFLESWNFNNISENAEALITVVNQAKEIARTKYGIEIYAIITDNASNMKAMGERIDLWNLTCNSHSGNLLCKSLINNEFVQKVNNLLTEFKHPDLESELISRGGIKTVLAGDTRWCSHRDALRSCLRNIPYMIEILNSESHALKAESALALRDESFQLQLQDNILILDPVCKLINLCQNNKTKAADAAEEWLDLQVPVDNANYEEFIRLRIEKALNKYTLAANLIHPKYRGRKFSDNQRYNNMVNDFFKNELSDVGLLQLQLYKDQTDLFQLLFERHVDDCKIFWRMASYSYPELSKVAIKLLDLPASTAELERLFSQWSHVHSKKRGR